MSTADAMLDAPNASQWSQAIDSPPPPPPAGGQPDLASGMKALDQRMQGTLAAKERETQPAIAAARAENAQPAPPAPKLEKVGDPPKSNTGEMLQQWLLPAVALSALAGAFTRQHVTSALNSFSAAVEGYKAGNIGVYEQKYKEWEASSKKAIQNNKSALDEYDAIWKNKKYTIDQKMNEIQLIAAKYQDRMTYEAAAQKNFTMVAQILQKQEMQTMKLETAYDKMKAQGDAMDAKLKAAVTPENAQKLLDAITKEQDPERKKNLQAFYDHKFAGAHAAAGSNIAIGDLSDIPDEGIGGLSREAIQTRAKMWADGNADGAFKGIGGFGIGSKLRNIISSVGAKMTNESGVDPNRKAIDFRAEGAGAAAGARTEATREAGLNIILRVTDSAIPAAIEQSRKVWRSGFVPLNKIIQGGQVATSDPELRAFGMANLQLAEGWARAMNPTGVMRNEDREKALSFLSTADSPQTYERLVMQLKTQLDRELAAVKAGKHRAPEPGGGGGASAAPPAAGGGGAPDPLGIR